MSSVLSIIPIILAGGIGQRLWPLSTPEKPKQFIPFLQEQSLFQHALKRVAPLATQPTTVITNQQHQELASQQAGAGQIIIATEPEGRNTAPACAYAALLHQKQPDAIVMICPADHFVPDKEAFAQTMQQAITHAAHNPHLVLVGIKPTYAATGFGYLQTETSDIQSAAPVLRFHEKPAAHLAQTYLQEGTYWWNSGIVVARVSTLLEQLALHAPTVLHTVNAYLAQEGSYEAAPKISFDYAVLERSDACWMVPASFQWYDVGNLETFVRVSHAYAPLKPLVIQSNATNNITSVHDKLVVCIGVHNLVVVEANNVLLIMDQHTGQEVHQVAQQARSIIGAQVCNP